MVFNYGVCVCGKERKERKSFQLAVYVASLHRGHARCSGRNRGEQRMVCVSRMFPMDQDETYKKVRRILTRTDSHQKSQGVEESKERARRILSA